MTGLIAKIEVLAAEVGTDIHTLWNKFEAFVKAEFEHKKAAEDAPATATEETATSVETPVA